MPVVSYRKWSERVSDLAAFKRAHGHTNVPMGYSSDKSLAVWVNFQRQEYRKYVKGKKSSMTASRIKDLDVLGFNWDPLGSAWQARLKDLVRYKKEHGHCNVPRTYKDNPGLARWVVRQREDMKLKRMGQTSGMTEERARALEGLGFHFLVSPRNSTKNVAKKADAKPTQLPHNAAAAAINTKAESLKLRQQEQVQLPVTSPSFKRQEDAATAATIPSSLSRALFMTWQKRMAMLREARRDSEAFRQCNRPFPQSRSTMAPPYELIPTGALRPRKADAVASPGLECLRSSGMQYLQRPLPREVSTTIQHALASSNEQQPSGSDPHTASFSPPSMMPPSYGLNPQDALLPHHQDSMHVMHADSAAEYTVPPVGPPLPYRSAQQEMIMPTRMMPTTVPYKVSQEHYFSNHLARTKMMHASMAAQQLEQYLEPMRQRRPFIDAPLSASSPPHPILSGCTSTKASPKLIIDKSLRESYLEKRLENLERQYIDLQQEMHCTIMMHRLHGDEDGEKESQGYNYKSSLRREVNNPTEETWNPSHKLTPNSSVVKPFVVTPPVAPHSRCDESTGERKDTSLPSENGMLNLLADVSVANRKG